MKAALFSSQMFWFDGKDYSTDEAYVKFVTSFYPFFERIVFCDIVAKERKRESYVLYPATTEVCPLPYFSVYSFWKNILVIFPKIYRIIRDNIQQWDIIWLPAPHPVSLIFAYACWRQHKPFFFIVRQNLIEQVRHGKRGAKRLYAMAVVAVLEHVCQRLANKTLTFTVGKEMYDAYKRKGGNVRQIAVSLVSERDIEETLRTKFFRVHRPVRLLTVGRLDPEKGIYFLIRAVEKLIKEKQFELVLQIVGKSFKGGHEQVLRQEVAKLRLTDNIHFLGHIVHGPQLFRLYRESDIFIVPSLTGEGIPQTLFEAMACGVPIIATTVAGIPDIIKDEENGLLINPGSPIEICEAVELLINDPELRKRIVKEGLETVRHHTLDRERERMTHYIQQFVEQVRLDGCRNR